MKTRETKLALDKWLMKICMLEDPEQFAKYVEGGHPIHDFMRHHIAELIRKNAKPRKPHKKKKGRQGNMKELRDLNVFTSVEEWLDEQEMKALAQAVLDKTGFNIFESQDAVVEAEGSPPGTAAAKRFFELSQAVTVRRRSIKDGIIHFMETDGELKNCDANIEAIKKQYDRGRKLMKLNKKNPFDF
jgi:hypothetical protein